MRQPIQYLYLLVLVVCCCGSNPNKMFRDLTSIGEYIKTNDPDGKPEYEQLRHEVKDPEDVPDVDLKLTKEVIKRIKAKNLLGASKCYSCPEYTGDDPNMKYQSF